MLLVRAKDVADADASVAAVETALRAARVRYVSVLCASSAVYADVYLQQTAGALGLSQEAGGVNLALRQGDDNTTTPADTTMAPTPVPTTNGSDACGQPGVVCYTSYFTPDINSALLVSAMLLLIMLVAMSCMCSLQSPERFEGSQKRVFISRVQPR